MTYDELIEEITKIYVDEDHDEESAPELIAKLCKKHYEQAIFDEYLDRNPIE